MEKKTPHLKKNLDFKNSTMRHQIAPFVDVTGSS